jgi:hypothetical protein
MPFFIVYLQNQLNWTNCPVVSYLFLQVEAVCCAAILHYVTLQTTEHRIPILNWSCSFIVGYRWKSMLLYLNSTSAILVLSSGIGIFFDVILEKVWSTCLLWTGQRSRYSNWLRAGRSGCSIPVGARISAPVQTGPEAHPASCTMGTGSFPGVKSGRSVTLTTHSLLVPWSIKGRAIFLLPLWAVRPVQSLSVCNKGALYFYFMCVFMSSLYSSFFSSFPLSIDPSFISLSHFVFTYFPHLFIIITFLFCLCLHLSHSTSYKENKKISTLA